MKKSAKKPITITVRKEQEKKIRELQAKMIIATGSNWSFSGIIDVLLEDAIKHASIKNIKKSS